MLTQVCDFIHNYFELSTATGTFSVADGSIEVDGLLEGQRFRIRGSALNDGIYTYHSDGIKNDDDDTDVALSTETFTGFVDLMGVPRGVLEVTGKIAEWVAKYGAVGNTGPYTSESFAGYSYTKKSGTDAHGNNLDDWRAVFGKSLNAYRKIA